MIVFDLDDTLYLERDFALSGYAHLDGLVRAETGVSGFGELCRTLFQNGTRAHIFDTACETLGLSRTDIAIGKLVEAYRNHPPDIRLCPDAQRFLADHPAEYGLITDGPEQMQRQKITALGLDRWISHIRPTGAWPAGYGKPHPRAFIEMEEVAGRDGRMVYVADNPAKDFVTPKARGWLTVQITRPGAIHDPTPKTRAHAADLEVTSLTEMPLPA